MSDLGPFALNSIELGKPRMTSAFSKRVDEAVAFMRERLGIEPGWIDRGKIEALLEGHKVSRVRYGDRENVTDGEAHIIYVREDGEEFELKANYYVSYTWAPLVRWVLGEEEG